MEAQVTQPAMPPQARVLRPGVQEPKGEFSVSTGKKRFEYS